MHKGDRVIADHPERDTDWLIRTYGIILEITDTGNVLIELADGTVINRHEGSVAVYIQSPTNWKELYKKQEVAFFHPRKLILASSQRTPSLNN